ncbi:MAG: ATP-binding cassette domain-containing protein, partial [Clostridia bacterium]|nr:ATP-binding cassette domain-containing protein [Clostridia bacterium]
MKKEILRVEKLNTSFEGEQALSNFRINLYEGEVLGVIGLNGSGKTTFVKVLSGVCQKDSGSIYLHHQLISLQNRKESNQLGIYAVQKENMLISNLTVAENIDIVKPKKIKNLIIKEKDMNSKMSAFLSDFDLDIMPDTLAKTLTKGQQVLIEILKAYASNPRLIILDDVIELFTYKEKLKLIKILQRLKEKKVSFIVTDYKFQSELNVFDRIAVIREGKTVKILHKEEFDNGLITNLAVGYEFKESFTRSSNDNGKVALELNHISVGSILKDINIKVNQGEILGIFDIESQSAIELVKLLSGKVRRYDGTVYVNQLKVNLDRIQNAVNNGIGIVSEGLFNSQLFRNMTATENAFFPLLKRASGPLGYVSKSA